MNKLKLALNGLLCQITQLGKPGVTPIAIQECGNAKVLLVLNKFVHAVLGIDLENHIKFNKI